MLSWLRIPKILHKLLSALKKKKALSITVCVSLAKAARKNILEKNLKKAV